MLRPIITALAATLAFSTAATAQQAYDWSGAYGGVSLAAIDVHWDFNTNPSDPENPFDAEAAPGVFAGYLFQNDAFVYGAEISHNIYDGEQGAGPFLFELGSQTELRARVGYAFDNVLVSASVGYASREFFSRFVDVRDNITGMTYGLGADYAINDRMFVGADWTHSSLNGSNASSFYNSYEVTEDAFRLRLGFRF
ncbi:outer membrane protein [Hasllibacter sp. MH4015]|uniref:outer membrane protein n=1 Tax=Hasllibacter sp. MH4015 TaxID=2854029 RepID=UPI001CD2B194|nr:outer membrane beta-barrel protein [Hasllibacter sp. MH4015]